MFLQLGANFGQVQFPTKNNYLFHNFLNFFPICMNFSSIISLLTLCSYLIFYSFEMKLLERAESGLTVVVVIVY